MIDQPSTHRPDRTRRRLIAGGAVAAGLLATMPVTAIPALAQADDEVGRAMRALLFAGPAEFADALVYDGQPEKSLEWLKKAMRLNPYYPDWYLWYLADAYNALGRSEDVIATVEKMRNPAEGRRMLAANYAHLGKLEKAEAQAREVLKLHPKFTISSWAQRPPYKDREVLDRYMEGLRKAGLPKE